MRRRHHLTRLFLTTTRPLRRVTGGLVVGLIVGVLAIEALNIGMFGDIRARLSDSLYRPRPTRGIVTIVAIDDPSLERYGRSTVDWDRQVYADLIRVLDAAGARVIVFDILFADPTASDAALAETMRGARNVIQPVLGIREATATVATTTASSHLLTYLEYIHPTADLKFASRALGHANVVPDDDNFVRRVPLFVQEGDQQIPALSLAACMEYLRLPPDAYEIDKELVSLAGRTLYTNDHSEMLIYYFGSPSHPNEPGTFPVYSLVDVVDGKVSPDAFKDQIVLIGVLDAAGLPDNFPTPNLATGEETYGIEIYANTIETIFQSLPKFQSNVDWKLNLGLFKIPLYQGRTSFPLREQPLRAKMLITFLIAVGAGVLLPFLRWYVAMPLTLLAYLAYFFWASAAFMVRGQIVELLFPSFALVFTLIGVEVFNYTFEERRRSQINDLFSRYVSPEIAQKIVEVFDQGKLELGGEEREITVLFADIRGFTPLSEGLPPAKVVELLNVFLEEMSSIVMRHGGAINKYIGDNIMAFWNAPYHQHDHAYSAVRAGLEMLEAVHRLNRERHFATPVQFGIGINTGPVVVGNIGSQRRLEYTPIGDTVNTASRLCGVAPGGSCYIGRRTYNLIKGRAYPYAVHRLLLKGKADPVDIFELRSEGEPARGDQPVSAPAVVSACAAASPIVASAACRWIIRPRRGSALVGSSPPPLSPLPPT